MAADGEVKIEGLDEVIKMLQQLPVGIRKKQLRRALRRGSVLLRDDIKKTAPIRQSDKVVKYRKGQTRPKPGRLRRLIRIKARRSKRGYLAVSLIYPTIGKGNNPKNAFYWRFLERGTKYISANPYLRRTAERQFQPIIKKVVAELDAGVKEEMAKAGVKKS